MRRVPSCLGFAIEVDLPSGVMVLISRVTVTQCDVTRLRKSSVRGLHGLHPIGVGKYRLMT